MARKPQFGSIYQRIRKHADGTILRLPTYWIAYHQHGKKHRESSHSTKYTVAEKLLKQRQAEMQNGSFGGLDAERIRVSELLDDLLVNYEINNLSVKWAKFVDGHLRPFFGTMKACTVGDVAFEKYILARREADISNATINRELALLRRAYNLGNKRKPPKVNKVPVFPKLTENSPRKGFFEHAAYVSIRAELPEYLRPLVTMAYYTGCRRGELLNLIWEQVDLAARIIRLEPGETKNDEARILPLGNDLLEVLRMQKATRDQLWPNCKWVFARNGNPILSIKTAWSAACTRAGLIDETGEPAKLFHDLRRTGVRNLVRAGVPEAVAMRISGHKTRSVFDRYNIVSERDLHEAAQRLDRYHAEQTAENPDRDGHTLGTPLPSEATEAKNEARKLLN